MKTLFDRLRGAADRIAQSSREQQRDAAVAAIEVDISRDRKAFDLDACVRRHRIAEEDLGLVAPLVYSRFARRAWRDNSISESERSTLDWLAQVLRLSTEQRHLAEREFAAHAFGDALVEALKDNVVTNAELDRLRTLATAVGASVSELIAAHFRRPVAAALLSIVADSALSLADKTRRWAAALEIAAKLGVPAELLRETLRERFDQLVDAAVSDAAKDERLTGDEAELLIWLRDSDLISGDRMLTLDQQIADLELSTSIVEGRLEPIVTSRTELEPDEEAYLEQPCSHTFMKTVKGQSMPFTVEGWAAITSRRLIFTSEHRSHAVSLPKVLGVVATAQGFELQTQTRGAGLYEFATSGSIATRLVRMAIKKSRSK